MAKIDLTYNIVNYTPASASPVSDNFIKVEDHINQELVERDGSVAMRAQLKLYGDPVADLDAAPKQYVDQVMPIGIIMMYGGAGAPPGGKWMVCNGQELQSSQYPALYHEIGHNFSAAGTPGSRFNLPNLQDRFPMGKGTNTDMGETGGFRNATLVEHEHGMKWHTHNMGNHTHPIDHDHPNSKTGAAGGHDHSLSQRGDVGTSGGVVRGGPAQVATGTTGSVADHTHTVDIAPQNNKNSGKPNDNVTSGPSDNVTSSIGSVATDKNLPPFQGVQFIIRVL